MYTAYRFHSDEEYPVDYTKPINVSLPNARVILHGHWFGAAGNLKTDAQPNGITTTYTYDSRDRLTDLSALNTVSNHLVFTQHFDSRNDGLRQDVIETRYNSDGTTFSTTKITWGYDGLGPADQRDLRRREQRDGYLRRLHRHVHL
jgi:YD repeat-containing protein